MKSNREREVEELSEIRTKLKHSENLDLDEVQELYYRKNFLESGLALDEEYLDQYGDSE